MQGLSFLLKMTLKSPQVVFQVSRFLGLLVIWTNFSIPFFSATWNDFPRSVQVTCNTLLRSSKVTFPYFIPWKEFPRSFQVTWYELLHSFQVTWNNFLTLQLLVTRNDYSYFFQVTWNEFHPSIQLSWKEF